MGGSRYSPSIPEEKSSGWGSSSAAGARTLVGLKGRRNWAKFKEVFEDLFCSTQCWNEFQKTKTKTWMSSSGPARAWTQICDLSEDHSSLAWLVQFVRNKIGQGKANRGDALLVVLITKYSLFEKARTALLCLILRSQVIKCNSLHYFVYENKGWVNLNKQKWGHGRCTTVWLLVCSHAISC